MANKYLIFSLKIYLNFPLTNIAEIGRKKLLNKFLSTNSHDHGQFNEEIRDCANAVSHAQTEIKDEAGIASSSGYPVVTKTKHQRVDEDVDDVQAQCRHQLL